MPIILGLLDRGCGRISRLPKRHFPIVQRTHLIISITVSGVGEQRGLDICATAGNCKVFYGANTPSLKLDLGRLQAMVQRGACHRATNVLMSAGVSWRRTIAVGAIRAE